MFQPGNLFGYAILRNGRLTYCAPQVEEILEQIGISTILNKDLSSLPQSFKVLDNITITVDSFDYESILCIFQDVRDWKNLLETNSELESIIYNSHDGILVADGEGNTIRVSPGSERHFGISSEELLGRNCTELEKAGIFKPSVILKVLEEKGPVTIYQETRTGKVLLTTGNPIYNENGKITRVICNSRDVTELSKLRVQLKEQEGKVQRYESELWELRKKETVIDGFIAHSKKMKNIISLLHRVAVFDSNVLITGESGTGKEVIAKSVHSLSLRNTGPFIKVNCGAIPENLLESELFGYETGAFTGAKKGGKPGYFELANNGTIFLDEIGEMPHSLQAKLLQVIQDKTIQRVGGTKTISINFRLIAATNRDLFQMVNKGEFREDLYYRLNVINIIVPPLREREEDIPFLAQYFIDKFNSQYNLEKKIDAKTMNLLCSYEWPGNVRQLQNVIERLIVLTNDQQIRVMDAYDLLGNLFGNPAYINNWDNEMGTVKIEESEEEYLINRISKWENDQQWDLQNILKEVEQHFIKKALHKYKTTRKAAKYLEMSQPTLVRRLKNHMHEE
ncbi:PAS domain S-box protein [Peribacillus saganii]|uniref:HTH-type transcriptional regulatory protein TyrR n=1 Tax=Peribacillus saganii TaxID=2303992 RepID=A0A372LRS0_9BACI|nr:sigma 54-interacting transcriptional regulator [Peribacillus saganii]RFU70895.1 PAS domain S-box protein [Peribacillus saganii]